MDRIICASGDSFTQEFLQEPEHRWTTQIGVTHNIAMGGAGNDRIFNATLTYLNETTPDILIVGWSSTARGSLYHTQGTRVIVAPHRCFDEQTADDYPDIQEFYYKNLHNHFINFTNTLNYMIFLQEYCRYRKIKLLYFRSVMDEELDDESLRKVAATAFMSKENKAIESAGVKSNVEKLKSLVSKLDKDIWIKQFWYSMGNHMEQRFPNSITQFDPHKPLLKEGIKDWGELVQKHL